MDSPGVALSSALGTAAAEAAAGLGSRIDPGGSPSPGLDPHLALRLKELELEIKIEELEAEFTVRPLSRLLPQLLKEPSPAVKQLLHCQCPCPALQHAPQPLAVPMISM
ncbi:hypothetical protein AOLI_G00283070 [Acnodon oligacanthus]